MLPYEISLYFFIFLESIQLILVLSSLFSKSNIIVWSGYILAGFKFSIASVLSIDMITYNIFYNQLGNIDADTSSGMEIGFVYLLYLAKSINLPMGVIHFSLVVFFLFTVNNFFTYLLPKREANTMTLVFGLFPVGGELCIYLLRQLASTSIVILGVTLSLRGKKIIGFIVYLMSLTFHISSIIYMPFVIIGFVKKKSLKVIVLVALYALIVSFFFLPPDIFIGATSGVDGGSDYTSKYEKYTTSFDDRSDTTIGLFTISTVAYLAWGLIKMYKQLKNTNMFYYGCSSLIMF